MSSAPLQRETRRTRAAQLNSELSASTSAPQKRKAPASEKTENGKSKKPRLPTVSEDTPASSSDTYVPTPAKQYGVYYHYDLSDLSGSDVELVGIAPDFAIAYGKLCDNASGKIGSYPTWDASYTRTLQNVYEILGPDNAMRIRYSIETMVRYGDGWKRERDWLAQDYLARPAEHWGIYLDINHAPESPDNEAETSLFGGFMSLGEAKNAMKAAAAAYLDRYPTMRSMALRIEFEDEKGGVRQRYRIVQGRYVQGRFVREEEWLEKAMGGLARGEQVEWEVKKSDIKRLPTPTSASAPAPEEPTLAPEEPLAMPEERVPALATPVSEEPALATPASEEFTHEEPELKDPALTKPVSEDPVIATPAPEEPIPAPEKLLPTPVPEPPTPAPEQSTDVLEESTTTPEQPTHVPVEPTNGPNEPMSASDELVTAALPSDKHMLEGSALETPARVVSPTPAPLSPISEDLPSTPTPTSTSTAQAKPENELSLSLPPEPEPEIWCTCRAPEGGFMICCDNESCAIQWYHGRCVGVRRAPRGKWFCGACKAAKGTAAVVGGKETARETRARLRSETPAVPVRQTLAVVKENTTTRETRAKGQAQTPGVMEGRVEKKTKARVDAKSGGRKK